MHTLIDFQLHLLPRSFFDALGACGSSEPELSLIPGGNAIDLLGLEVAK